MSTFSKQNPTSQSTDPVTRSAFLSTVFSKSQKKTYKLLRKEVCHHGMPTFYLEKSDREICAKCGMKTLYPMYRAQHELNKIKAYQSFDEFLDGDGNYVTYSRFRTMEESEFYPFHQDWATDMSYLLTPMTLLSKTRVKALCGIYPDSTLCFRAWCANQDRDIMAEFDGWAKEGKLYERLLEYRPEQIVKRMRKTFITKIMAAHENWDVDEETRIFNEGLMNILRKYGDSKMCAQAGCPMIKKRFGKFCRDHALINMFSRTKTGEAQFVAENVGDFFKTILERSGPIHHDIPILRELMNTIIESKEEIVHQLEQEREKHKGVNWLKVALSAGACALTISRCLGDKIAITSSLAQFVLSLDIIDNLKGQLLDYILGLFKPQRPGPDEGEAQIDAGSIEKIAMVAGPICVTIVAALALGSIPQGKGFKDFVQTYSKMGAMISSTEMIFEKAKQLTALVIGYIKKNVFGIVDEDEWTMINKWCDDVQKIMNTDLETNIRGNAVLKSSIDTMIIRGNKILKIFDDLKIPLTQRTRVQSCMMYLHKARSMAATGGAGHTEQRVAPIIVHLVGASGTGKSSILYPLMAKLLVSMGSRDPDDLRTKCYFKNPSKDGRWDGYPNECEIVVCDDIFTQKDSIANPSQEAMEAIRMSNTAFYQLAMAELKDKGTTFFKAKTVIWTSNKHSFNFESLTNKEALIRRITVRYRQKPHPDFSMTVKQDGKLVEVLDQIKVGKAVKQDKTSLTKVVLFDREDTALEGDPVVIRKDMTFEEMASEVIAMNSENLARFADYSKGVDAFMREEIARVESEETDTIPNTMVDIFNEVTREMFGKETPEEKTSKNTAGSSKSVPKGESRNAGSITCKDCRKKKCICRCSECKKKFDDCECTCDECGLLFDDCECSDDFDYGEAHIDEPPEIFYYEDSWFNWLKDNRHINITDSILGYMTPSFVSSCLEEEAEPSPHHFEVNGKHYVECSCFTMSNKVQRRFVYAYARATAATCISKDVRRFDAVFWKHYAQIPRLAMCDDHVPMQHTKENFFTHMRRHFARYACETDLNRRMQCTFEEIHEQQCYLSWVLRGISVAFLILQVYLLYRGVKKVVSMVKSGVSRVVDTVQKAGSFVKGLFVTPEEEEKLPEEIQAHLEHTGDTKGVLKLRKAMRLLPKWAQPTNVESKNVEKTKGRRVTNVESKNVDKTKGRKVTNVEDMDNVEFWNFFFSEDRDNKKTFSDYGWLKPFLSRYMEENDIDELESGIIPASFATQFGKMIDDLEESVGITKAREIILGLIEIDGEIQSITDQNAAELGPIVIRNLYKLMYFEDGEWRRALNILFLKGRIAITNKHVTVKRNVNQWRIVNQSGNAYEFNLWACASSQFSMDDGDDYFRDVIMFEFPKYVTQHVDITAKFMKNEDFSRFSSLAQACLFTYDPVQDHVRYMFTNTIDSFDKDFGLMSNGQVIGRIRKYFNYGIQTTKGDCGGLLCAYDQSFARKLIGIHAAGTNNSKYQGVGQPVTQEVLEKLFKKLTVRREDSLMFPNVDKLIKNDITVTIKDGILESSIESNFVHFGEVNQGVHHPKKSNIRPSLVHGVICEPTMKPAHLGRFERDGIEIDPMSLARSKASFSPTEPEQKLVDSCVKHYSDKVSVNIAEQHRRVLNLEESIKGIEGDEFMDGINRRTSAGYLLKGKGPGKTQWLGTDDYITNDPFVVEETTKLLDVCKSGQRPTVVWVDTLKDERRPIAKVDQGKTRLFSVGEMIFTIVFRQYFLGFTGHMMRNRIDLESCIGTNVYNRDWTRIADKITSVGPHVIAGDFANYDGSMNATMLWSVLDVIEDFYQGSAEDRRVRKALWSEVVNSIHVYENKLYGWTHSNPSGCPITAILNSVYHSISARYVFLLCAREYSREHYNLHEFDKHVRHINYGDDDIWNISPVIIEWFNQVTITKAYEKIGMTYTDEAKTGVIVESRTLDQVQFLKREFRWDEDQGRYRAPLSLVTIREMPMWVRGCVDVRQLTEDTLLAAVHELSQHSREVFEEEVKAFEVARRSLGPLSQISFHDYDHYQDIEFNKWCDIDFHQTILPLYRETALCGNVQVDGKQDSEEQASSCKSRAQCITMYKSSKQNPNPNFEFEWNYILDLQRKDADQRTKLNLAIQKHPDAQFMMDFHNDLKRYISQYKIKLNEYKIAQQKLEAFRRESRELEKRLNCIYDASQGIESGEIQMEAGETETTQILSGEEQVVQRQIVQFHDDAPVISANVPFSRDFQSYDQSTSDNLENSVKGILERPIILQEGAWKQADTISTSLWSHNLPTAWIAKNLNIRQKLDGFRFLRCDFRITMQVNAQPFNAGCALLYFEPFSEQMTVPPTSADITHFGGITGYRHVKLDLSNATTVEMVVPFMCPESHFDLTSGGGYLGKVRCLVYSQLRGGANDVDFTVYCNAENISLEMPTGQPIFDYTTPHASGEIQMDSTPESKQGTISGIAKSISGVANVFTGVPEIGPVAASVAWAADAAAGVASMFGFSKPLTDSLTDPVQVVNNRFYNNFDGDSKGKNLGLSSRNTVSTPAGHFQTTEDEMAIRHIISKPIYTDRFKMDNTMTAGTQLWAWAVSPYTCNQTYTSPLNVRFNTYLSYLATMFKFWRGGINFHVRIVKTMFHSGRIRVSYIPGLDGSLPITELMLSKSYSQIIDIREKTSFDFEIPYAMNVPWLMCRDVVIESTGQYALPINTGYIVITVVNALRNPSTAADEIEFIVETSGASDFQFAGPALSGIDFLEKPAATGEIQIADVSPPEPLFSMNKLQPLDPCTSCMGEVIVSLRQYLKRFSFMKSLEYDSSTNKLYNLTVVGPADLHDIFDWTRALYRFYSGSMRVVGVSNDLSIGATYFGYNFPSADLVPTFDANPSGKPEIPVFNYLEPCQEIEVPYYNMTPASMTDVGLPKGTSVPTFTPMTSTYPINPSGISVELQKGSGSLFINRAIGEDFSFGYLMGPPITYQMPPP